MLSKDRGVYTERSSLLDSSGPTVIPFEAERNPPTPFMSLNDENPILENSPTSQHDKSETPIAIDSRSRISEWDENSGALVADAYNVRRLLRFATSQWKLYIASMDRILDALYISEKEGEIKATLSIILRWVMYCQYRRAQQGTFERIRFRSRLRAVKVHFKSWNRLQRSNTGLVAFLQDRRLHLEARSLCGWRNWTRMIARPEKQLEFNRNKRRSISTWSLWKKARTIRFLDNMQAIATLERSHVCRAFNFLKRNASLSIQTKGYQEGRDARLSDKLLLAWKGLSQDRLAYRTRLIANPTATYLAFKLLTGHSSPHSDVHVGVHIHVRDQIGLGVGTIALRKWREYSWNQKMDRQEKTREAKNVCFVHWRRFVEGEKISTRAGRKLNQYRETVGDLRRLKLFFHLWTVRYSRRHMLRNNLANFSEKCASWLLVRSIASWQMVARSERVLASRSNMFRRRKRQDLFLAWRRGYSAILSERIRGDIANLFRRKILGSILVGCFQLVQRRRRWIQSIEAKGDFLAGQIRFLRWRAAFERSKLVKKIHIISAKKNLENSFQNWLSLSRAVVRAQQRELENIERLKKVLLKTFRLNLVQTRKDRMDSVIATECLKRSAFARFKRFAIKRREAMSIRQRCLLLTALRRWIKLMVISHGISRLNFFRSRQVVGEALGVMSNFASEQIKIDESKTIQVLESKMIRAMTEWRLVALGSRLVRYRNQREALTSVPRNREVIEKSFLALREEFSFRQRLLLVCYSRNQRLARAVFSQRNSGWLLAIKTTNLERKASGSRVRASFLHWLMLRRCNQSRNVELASSWTQLDLWRKRTLFYDLMFIARTRISEKGSIFLSWRKFSIEKHRNRDRCMLLAPKRARVRLAAAMRAWVLKKCQRDDLRERVGDFAVNNTRRLLVSGVIGFAQTVDHKRRFREIRLRKSFSVLNSVLDGWIHATVFRISLKEVLGRLEHITGNFKAFKFLEKLRNITRIERFWARRNAQINSKSNEKLRNLCEAVLLGWSAAAFKRKKLHEKVLKMNQKRFFLLLRVNRDTERDQRVKAELVEELAVKVQARHFSDLIADLIAEWRVVTDIEADLRSRANLAESIVSDRVLYEMMDRWKSALEFKLYDNDLMTNESILMDRIEQRTLSNVFTYLVLIHKEAQGLLIFASEYREGKVKASVVSWLANQVVMSRKTRAVQSAVNSRLVRTVFLEIFTQVYLSMKERLVFRRNAAERLFYALRVNVDHRQRVSKAEILGRWRIHKYSESLSSEWRLLSMVLAAWFAVASQTRLTKQYLPAFDLSYTQRRKVDPQTAAGTPTTLPAGTPTLFSYRELRPKRSIGGQRV